MNAPLLSTGKLVKNGDAVVVMDKPDAHVITGNTKTTIQNIIEIAAKTNPDDIMLKVPFNERSLTWRTVGNDDTGSIFHGSTNGPIMHSTTDSPVIAPPLQTTWTNFFSNVQNRVDPSTKNRVEKVLVTTIMEKQSKIMGIIITTRRHTMSIAYDQKRYWSISCIGVRDTR